MSNFEELLKASTMTIKDSHEVYDKKIARSVLSSVYGSAVTSKFEKENKDAFGCELVCEQFNIPFGVFTAKINNAVDFNRIMTGKQAANISNFEPITLYEKFIDDRAYIGPLFCVFDKHGDGVGDMALTEVSPENSWCHKETCTILSGSYLIVPFKTLLKKLNEGRTNE